MPNIPLEITRDGTLAYRTADGADVTTRARLFALQIDDVFYVLAPCALPGFLTITPPFVASHRNPPQFFNGAVTECTLANTEGVQINYSLLTSMAAGKKPNLIPTAAMLIDGTVIPLNT